jgi:hypothetical protein
VKVESASSVLQCFIDTPERQHTARSIMTLRSTATALCGMASADAVGRKWHSCQPGAPPSAAGLLVARDYCTALQAFASMILLVVQ